MKPEAEENQGSSTYNDAMNEWADGQQSFFRRARSGFFHPSATFGVWRFLGYLWRLILAVAVIGGVGTLIVKRHVKSQAFANMLGDEIREYLGAETVKLNPFVWEHGVAVSPLIVIEGGAGSFFHHLEGRHIRIERTFWSLFSRSWKFDAIAINEATLQVRSGGYGITPVLEPGADDAEDIPFPGLEEGTDGPETKGFDGIRFDLDTDFDSPEGDGDGGGGEIKVRGGLDLKAGGFGLVHPDLRRLEFEKIEIAHLTLSWGLSEFTRGALRDARATFTPSDGESGWTLEAEKGTLEQNWLRGFTLEGKLRLGFESGSLVLRKTALKSPGGGAADLSGRVIMGDLPDLDFTLEMSRVPVVDLLNKDVPAARVLSGLVDGTAKITGSTNTNAGIEIKMEGTLSEGVVRNIPVFGILALPTARSAFRLLPVTGGAFALATRQGRIEVTNLALESGDDIRIGGGFSFEEDQFDGTIEIGLDPKLLDGSPLLRDEYFTGHEGGFTWMPVAVEGAVDDLTRELSERVFAAYQEEDAGRR